MYFLSIHKLVYPLDFCLHAPLLVNLEKWLHFSKLLNKERQTCHLSVSHCGRLTKYSHNADLQVACSVYVCVWLRLLKAISLHSQWQSWHFLGETCAGLSHTDKKEHKHTHIHIYYCATEELIKCKVSWWKQNWKKTCLCVRLNHAECSVGERQAGQLWQLRHSEERGSKGFVWRRERKTGREKDRQRKELRRKL